MTGPAMDNDHSDAAKKAGQIAALIAVPLIFIYLFSGGSASTPKKHIAHSGTITRAFAGCLSEDALDEMLTAASHKDFRQMSVLLDSGYCQSIKGRSYSVESMGLMTSRIRVYSDEGSILLYTPSEALLRSE